MSGQECCVCYSTTDDIEPALKNSFITIPCGGNHIVCFSCFMRNVSTKCPMCRFNYKTMKSDDELPSTPRYELDWPDFEPNEDIVFINNWWVRLKDQIPQAIEAMERQVFDKHLNLITVNRYHMIDAIHNSQTNPDNLLDMESDYAMCARMYLTKMLVAFDQVENDDYSNFVLAVNDYAQYERDTRFTLI